MTETQTSNNMRKRADWMNPVDEKILEKMRDYGNMTAKSLGDEGICAVGTARTRLLVLVDYGLVQRISRGLYRITEEGKQFLDGELDASELEPVDDS